jgi:phosphoribosylformylglycinamidine (FGAM) synthase-like enzyme
MKTYLYIVLGFFLVLTSCREDFTFEPSNGNLGFSRDTIYLDTVFTDIGSSTYTLKVYNRSNKNISIPSIRLGKGAASKYQLMVDGMPGKEFLNVEMLAKDSMFIFVSVNADVASSNPTDFLYTDQLLFGVGTNFQKVELVTLIQDAYFLYPERFGDGTTETLPIGDDEIYGFFLDDNDPINGNELHWNNSKPYVIYGYAAIPANQTLTVDAGARIHFHAESGLIVANNASLQVNGTNANQVVFEGDRLEPGFSETPGQWGTIWFTQGSTNNILSNLTVKNATVGMLVTGNDGTANPSLTLNNMIHFFGNESATVFAVQSQNELSAQDITKLNWLFGNTNKIEKSVVTDFFVGPRAAMITPWSTNAVEITQNMGIHGIIRIEEFHKVESNHSDFDPMLFQKYSELHQDIFTINIQPESIKEIEDIAAYNKQEGLALSDEEVNYLNTLAIKLKRNLTDSEVFGFSQVNSEHCRHKIFNGTFVIDGEEKPSSLFKLIKKTSAENPNDIVSAYKDNVAFIKGPKVEQFAPKSADKPDFYQTKEFDSVISLKAETHNFPTTVEPFNGAATGSGGEIRDRLAGGQGSLPLAGTAVYMTSYSRLEETRPWENAMEERKWLYQTPMDILIKASNGASDFGNKFGQPLITGSVLTFEHEEDARKLGFDKVIMLAGGIGYGKADQAQKHEPKAGDKIVILGGENYRIGMGGAAVSSADTGAFGSGIELNAIQRSNPEMQKRAANAIRGLVESDENPIVSIHDHGAGGHLNCLSELVEATGGLIDLDKLPVGDPTLSAKEIIGNESQERMGLVIGQKDIETLQRIADRERSPMYQVGDVTGDHRFTFESKTTGAKPMDFELADMFGSSPKMIMKDVSVERNFSEINYKEDDFETYLEQVLQLEAVACKDWLTNKVDRCVGGKVAKQQCAGPLQLPLNNVGVMALDYKGKEGIATSIGHSPISALIDPKPEVEMRLVKPYPTLFLLRSKRV